MNEELVPHSIDIVLASGVKIPTTIYGPEVESDAEVAAELKKQLDNREGSAWEQFDNVVAHRGVISAIIVN